MVEYATKADGTHAYSFGKFKEQQNRNDAETKRHSQNAADLHKDVVFSLDISISIDAGFNASRTIQENGEELKKERKTIYKKKIFFRNIIIVAIV